MTGGDVLADIVAVAALGINLHAVVALVRGMRAREARVIAQHARRCGWSAAGFAVLLGTGLTASILTNAPRGNTVADAATRSFSGDVVPSEKATRLAMMISELMNTVAFGVLVVVLPCIAAVVLHLRARRARG